MKQKAFSSSGPCVTHKPILAHVIRRSNSTGGISTTDLFAALANMNNAYASACVGFYFAEIRYIDDDNYYDFSTSDENTLHAAFSVDNIINIYFANSVSSGSSFYCGYAYFPGGRDIILMDNSCTNNGSTLIHEVGHFFNLPHTHSGGNELVNGSNCTTAGDGFCDTPADPNLSSVVNSSCVYTGVSTDANGDPYMPDPTNIMSYSRKSCRNFYSVEQLTEVRYIFEVDRNYFVSTFFNNDFSANLTQTCASSMTVQFSEQAVGESSYQWDFDNDGVIDATSANPTNTYLVPG